VTSCLLVTRVDYANAAVMAGLKNRVDMPAVKSEDVFRARLRQCPRDQFPTINAHLVPPFQ
jgi:hypothetical protein